MIRALAALALLAIASSATAAQPAGIPAYCTTAGAFGHRFGVDHRGSRAHREFDHSIDPEFAPFTRVEITRTVRSGATYAINASSDFEDGDDEARQAAARAAYQDVRARIDESGVFQLVQQGDWHATYVLGDAERPTVRLWVATNGAHISVICSHGQLSRRAWREMPTAVRRAMGEAPQ